jgi:hypothetical protein
LDNASEHLQGRRYLDVSKIKVKLKDDTEPPDSAKPTTGTATGPSAATAAGKKTTLPVVSKKVEFKPNPEEEQKEIATFEKNVNIRFCNYSMLVRAS